MRFWLEKIFEAKRYLFKNEQPLWIYLVCGSFGLRLLLGEMQGYFIAANGYHDDILMIRYSQLIEHFINHNLPPQDLLVKDMGFPLILRLVKFTGIPYSVMMSLLWFFAALSTVALVRVLTEEKNLWRDLAVFVFVLFAPVAFEYTGTRIYRNSAMAQMYFIALSMMSIFFVWHFIKPRVTPRVLVAFNVVFGLAFTLTYYIKEDGIWLLGCLLAVMFVCFVRIILSGEQILPRVALLMIPLIIFAGSTVAYKGVNKICFGVYLINNRTEGELGNFLKLIYKIKSDERTGSVWAPIDALNQAFNASKTLRENSALKEAVWHTGWFKKDIEKNPIQGDFLGWVMLSELYNSGTCHTLREQEEFLGKVNAELEAAFDANILQRDDRFQLVSSMGGMTKEEIFSLFPAMLLEYKAYITLHHVEPNRERQNMDNARTLKLASRALRMNLAKYAEPRFSTETANAFIKKLFAVYSAVQGALFIAALLGVIFGICTIRQKIFSVNEYLMLAIASGSLLLSLVYAFAIAWFCKFLSTNMAIFYGVGLVPMLTLFEIFGTYLLYRMCKNKF